MCFEFNRQSRIILKIQAVVSSGSALLVWRPASMIPPAEVPFDGSSILHADTCRLGVYAVIVVKTLQKKPQKSNIERQYACKNKSAQMVS